MKRRNFLKLLGIGLLPMPALAAASPAPTVEPTVETVEHIKGDSADWMILETPPWLGYTVEIDNQDVQCLGNETAEDVKQHTKWCRDNNIGDSDNQFLLVSKKSMVYVASPDGQAVWFRPQWNTVEERFETVVIKTETVHDRFLSEDGAALLGESKATTMSANIDGEVIAYTVRDW